MGHISLALVAAGLFATTNVDDLFLLVGFFSDRNLASWQVVLGQILGVAVLIAISLSAALAALAFSPSYVGLLGFAPIILGVFKIWSLLVTIASGADNIGVYTPFLAAQTPTQIAIIVFVFIALTIAWCVTARWLVSHRAIGTFLRSAAPIVSPVVLIVLGLSILDTTGAGALIARFAR
jgi:cadmium resistance protein CadD (predicted permease)